MEHALPNQDAVLAAFLEPGTIPELAKRVNMSLAALAIWTSKHAELIEGVHAILIARCKLIKAHLELSALTALATVSRATTATDDPKLRERALERQRKAANAILRHRTWIERTPRASVGPHAPSAAPEPPQCEAALPPSPRTAGRSTPSAARGDEGMPPAHPTRKPSLAERFAARRLAALAT